MPSHTSSSRRRLIALAAAVATSAGILSLAAPASAGAASAPAVAPAPPSFTRIEGAAADAAGLQPTVDAYRALLGDPNNGSALGSQPAGRREINWDGVPDAQADPNLLPRDFFNTVVPRGVVFSSSAGSRFLVSANQMNPTHTPVRFGRFNPQYPHNFATFSPQRLFTPVGTNKMSIKFFVPGSTAKASVKGFGAVFTDVDKEGSTKIELYDEWGTLLWWRNVPKGPTASKSLSFLGVKSTADIHEVRITSGNVPLGSTDTGIWDVVVMDDFLYAEPQPL